jgi:electron transfer flavoprotein beta subunit
LPSTIGTRAFKIAFSEDKKFLEVTKEVDAGLETVRLRLPSVITCDLRLNEPVFAKLPEIMKAKKKQLDVFTPTQLGVDVKPRLKTIKVTEPAKREGGKIVGTVDELWNALKKEGVV